jgi:hydrogenase nickel incorporation protein HypB
MFAAADLMLLNKIDLLPHLNFDIEQCMDYARQVNPKIHILQISATTGEGQTRLPTFSINKILSSSASKDLKVCPTICASK